MRPKPFERSALNIADDPTFIKLNGHISLEKTRYFGSTGEGGASGGTVGSTFGSASEAASGGTLYSPTEELPEDFDETNSAGGVTAPMRLRIIC